MNVKDLLLSCPLAELAEEVCRQEENLDDPETAAVMCEYVILQLEEKEPLDTGHVLIGISFLFDGQEWLDPCLYRKEEFFGWNGEPKELSEIESVQKLSDAEVESLLGRGSSLTSYGFDFAPWNEILGYELLEENIADIGAIALAAAILEEMTFFGYTEGDAEEQWQEVEERVEEAERYLALPPEERERHFRTLEEVMQELGLPQESPEEKEAGDKLFRREVVENRMREYRALQKYAYKMRHWMDKEDFS